MPQNDGEVRIEITGDSSKIEKKLKETESAVQNTTKSISEMTDALEDTSGTTESFENIAESAEDAAKAVSDVSTATESLENIAESTNSAAKNIAKATNETKDLGDSIKDEAKAAEKAGDAHENGLNPKIKETGKQAEKSGNKVSGFESKLKALGTAAAAGAKAVTAIATAATAAVAAIIKVTSDTAAYADTIDKASQKLGVSAEFYQEWEAVLQHSGTSMESMSLTFKTLANAAQDMSKDQQAAFEKLGISIEDVANLSAEDLFEQVISRLQQMEEGTERTAIATDLLGRGAMEMGALLNTSAEDTQKMIDAVHELGGVMSNEAVKAGAAFQDSLQDLQTALNGVKNNLASDFLPLAVEIMDGLAAVFSGDESGIEKAKQGIQNFIDELSEQLPKVAEFGGEVITALLEGISENLSDITGVATDIIGELVLELIALAPTLVNSAVEIINQLIGFLKENSYTIADGAVSIITSLANGISNLLPELIPTIVDIVKQIVKGITDNTGALIDAAVQLILSLGTGLIMAIPQLWESSREIPKSIADSIINYDWGSVAKSIMTNIADALDKAQKEFQIWLDNTFSDGTVYGGDIANVDTTNFVNNMREGIEILTSETEEYSQKIAKPFSTMADEIAKRGKESEKAARKAAENTAKAFDNGGKEIEEAAKKSTAKEKSVLVQNMEALERLYKQRQITEEEYQKRRLEYLEKNRDEESDEWTKYYDSVLTYYEKFEKEKQKEAETAAKKAKQEAEKLLSEQEKTVEKSLSNILKNFQKAYDELEKKRENYKKKLLSIGGDIFSVNEIENPDGSKTEEYAVNNINEQLKKMREYHASITKLKNEGASKGLLEELTSLDDDKSAEFAKYLARMSEAEFSKINALYNEKQKLAEELSNELYADEYKEIADGVNSALDEASKGAADKGKEAAESYAKAFSAELEKRSEDFYALLGNSGVYKKWFENPSDTPNLFDFIGVDTDKLTKLFMGSNFADIAAKVASTVSSEQVRYSAAAYTAPIVQNNYDTSQTSEFKKSAELDEILKKLNKPVQVVLDGKVIAETVMNYQNDYRRQSGG